VVMALVQGSANTHQIAHGTLGGLDFNTVTILQWVYPTTLTVNRAYWGKNQRSSPFNRCEVKIAGTTSEPRIFWTGSTALAYECTNAGITVNKWWFLAVVIDIPGGGAGGRAKFYVGDLSTAATLRTVT